MSKRQELENNTKKNLCCTLVLPMCEINHNSLPHNFTNAYLHEYKDIKQIVVVFDKPLEHSNSFMSYLDYLKQNRNYSAIEDIDNEIILYFTIPNRNLENLKMYLKGKYSQFSKDYKELLCAYFGRKPHPNKTSHEVYEFDVIFPQEYKRLAIAKRLGVDINDIDEVLDIPNLEKEQFRSIKKLEELNNQYDNKQSDTIEHHNFQ